MPWDQFCSSFPQKSWFFNSLLKAHNFFKASSTSFFLSFPYIYICCSLRTFPISLKVVSSMVCAESWFCKGLAFCIAQTPQVVWKSRFLELMMLKWAIENEEKIFPYSSRQNIPFCFGVPPSNLNRGIFVFGYTGFCTMGSTKWPAFFTFTFQHYWPFPVENRQLSSGTKMELDSTKSSLDVGSFVVLQGWRGNFWGFNMTQESLAFPRWFPFFALHIPVKCALC